MHSLVEIATLAEDFTNRVLADTSFSGMCYTVCYPLQIYLTIHDIDCVLAIGHYRQPAPPTVSHYWIRLLDLNSTIIDPTIKQFEADWDQTYIGNKTSKHEEDPTLKIDESQVKWEKRLSAGMIDLLRYLPVNFRAAELILAELDENKTNIEMESHHKFYFGSIKQLLDQYASQFGISANEYPRLFATFYH